MGRPVHEWRSCGQGVAVCARCSARRETRKTRGGNPFSLYRRFGERADLAFVPACSRPEVLQLLEVTT